MQNVSDAPDWSGVKQNFKQDLEEEEEEEEERSGKIYATCMMLQADLRFSLVPNLHEVSRFGLTLKTYNKKTPLAKTRARAFTQDLPVDWSKKSKDEI